MLADREGLARADSALFLPVACLVIAAVIVLLYGQTLSYGYVGIDDVQLIQRDHAFLRDLSNLPHAFTRDVFGKPGPEGTYYRPILTLSFMLDTQVGGIDLTAFRVTNVLLHVVASCLVLCLLLAIGTRRPLAFFLALLFAVHPLHVPAVALILGRNDPLLAVFALSGLLLLIRFVRTGSPLIFGLHTLCFALALFTKESGLALLAVQPLLLGLVLRHDLRSRRSRALGAAWLVVTALWFTLRSVALPLGSGSSVGLRGLLSNLPALPQYFGKMPFPFDLSIFPTIRDTGYVWGVLALGLVLAALLVSRGIDWRRVLFGAAWFLAFLLPSLAVSGFPGFEHRMYLPLVGFLIAASGLRLPERLVPGARVVAAAAAGVVVVCFGISFVRCQDFRSFDSFWTSAVTDSPHSRVAHLFFGARLAERGRLEEASEVLEGYLERSGGDAYQIHAALGRILLARNRFREAETHFQRELEIDPTSADALFHLGLLYATTGRADRAAEHWRRTLEEHPRHVEAYRALLDLHESRGEHERARALAEEMRRMGITER